MKLAEKEDEWGIGDAGWVAVSPLMRKETDAWPQQHIVRRVSPSAMLLLMAAGGGGMLRIVLILAYTCHAKHNFSNMRRVETRA